MTIKELEDLKEYAVTMLHGHADEGDPLKMTFTKQDRQILGLIDAELERQSVTDGEVTNAIHNLKLLGITVRKQYEQFDRRGDKEKCRKLINIYDSLCLAIQTLQAYRPFGYTCDLCECGFAGRVYSLVTGGPDD